MIISSSNTDMIMIIIRIKITNIINNSSTTIAVIIIIGVNHRWIIIQTS